MTAGSGQGKLRAARICASDELPDLGSHVFEVDYRGERRPAIVVRHAGVVYGYLNRCVHMPKRLDCEHPEVFDASGKLLRCSMHGLVYDPASGRCGSEICADRSLVALAVAERDGAVFLCDKRARLVCD